MGIISGEKGFFGGRQFFIKNVNSRILNLNPKLSVN